MFIVASRIICFHNVLIRLIFFSPPSSPAIRNSIIKLLGMNNFGLIFLDLFFWYIDNQVDPGLLFIFFFAIFVVKMFKVIWAFY